MKRNGWIILGVVVGLLAVGWLAVSPIFVLQDLGQAARAGDRRKLAALIDFPAVRADLKAQLAARVARSLNKDRDNPFGALGALLAPSVVDQVVDAAVTPDGIAAILLSGRAPLTDLGDTKPALPPPAETAPPPEVKSKATPRFTYDGINRFKSVRGPSENDRKSLGWVIERRGLGWKLVSIELPPG